MYFQEIDDVDQRKTQTDVTCKCGLKLCIFLPDKLPNVIILGDEIITNTSPTLIKLSADDTSFYVRIRGDQAQITLSEAYDSNVNAFTFTWGDGDDKSFTIRNQVKYIYTRVSPKLCKLI